MFKRILVASAILVFAGSLPVDKQDAVACQNCNPVDPNKINVHLIPHSHDDVGWLKTLDQYYYGSHSEIQSAGVQYIISSVVEALKENPNRRYMQVETAFFHKWWLHQEDRNRQDFINLVNSGQLEIVNAAWSMNDEAAVNYQSTVDQFTWGLRFINDTVGECGAPRAGWQIDPFGHSREQASIFAQLGYQGVFFARLDFQDKWRRIDDKTMEVIWKGSANSDNRNIFTNIFPEFYGNPDGYCFDIWCGEGDVIIDDPTSPDYNVPQKVQNFGNHMIDLATYYRTSNLLIPMGGDFQYQAAEKNFANMDKLIAGFEGHDQINILYSTPTCYIKAVNDEATANNVEFVVKNDDFFPYGSDWNQYWTGYFTSRPNSKRFERKCNNHLQAAKQLASFAKVNGVDREEQITPLREAIGVLQHHDAITGTAKFAVANDYRRLLTRAAKMADGPIGAGINDLLKRDPSSDVNLNFETCLLTNVSVCDITKESRFVVAAYNPLSRPVSTIVRVPIPNGAYELVGSNGGDIFTPITDFTAKYPQLNPSPLDLLIDAGELPPLGVKLIYVENTEGKIEKREFKPLAPQARFGTDDLGFEIDDATGLLSSVIMNGVTLGITQEFLYYESFSGDNSADISTSSGAYLFRPLNQEPVAFGRPLEVSAAVGTTVDEVRQVITSWITQIIRVYKTGTDSFIEFDWIVGPIDSPNNIGREVITRFTVADFNNAGTFYTDSNGRELIRRQRNARPDYDYDYTIQPVTTNYYPVTSKIVIKDEARGLQVAVLNDRAQGGSSLSDGVIELMVHRRLFADDVKGVDEALSDTEYGVPESARGQHYLVIGTTDTAVETGTSTAAKERDIALKKLLQPVVVVASLGDLTLTDIENNFNFNYAGLAATLPPNVHLLTLEPWKENSYILRLEHILENNEDSNLSQTVTVDLTGLFTLFEVDSIRETTLGANIWLDEFQKRSPLSWNVENGKVISNNFVTHKSIQAAPQITLAPMEIRTFIVTVTRK